jgi:hypothetical protein
MMTSTIITSCDSTSLVPLNSRCSAPELDTRSFNMLDSDTYTIINDGLTCKSPINVISDTATATQLYLNPVDSECTITQEAQSEYLSPVEHASIIADCLDVDDCLTLIDDISASCKTSADKVSDSKQTSKSSNSAGNDDENSLAGIGGSSSRSATHTINKYCLVQVNDFSKSSISVQSEYIAAAADATSHCYVSGVVDDSNHYSGCIFTGDAQNYTSLADAGLHEQQQEQARESDYDNTTEPLDLSNYDNNAALNISANEVSLFTNTQIRSLFQYLRENHVE